MKTVIPGILNLVNAMALGHTKVDPHERTNTSHNSQIRRVYGFDSIETMFAKAKTGFFKVLSVNGNRTLQFSSSVESHVVE